MIRAAGGTVAPLAQPRRIAIVQPNYVPWLGYFDLVRRADEVVLYDDVQYTKNDWRNRNRIRTRDGLVWLTIPVRTRGRFGQRICDAEVADGPWAARHLRTLVHAYGRAPGFTELAPELDELYARAADEGRLLPILELFLDRVCRWLQLPAPIRRSSDLAPQGDRNGRLLDLCRRLGANEYLSGPAARCYLDAKRFTAAGVAPRFLDYGGLPRYTQVHGGPFVPGLSILDLVANAGISGARALLHGPAAPSRGAS